MSDTLLSLIVAARAGPGGGRMPTSVDLGTQNSLNRASNNSLASRVPISVDLGTQNVLVSMPFAVCLPGSSQADSPALRPGRRTFAPPLMIPFASSIPLAIAIVENIIQQSGQ